MASVIIGNTYQKAYETGYVPQGLRPEHTIIAELKRAGFLILGTNYFPDNSGWSDFAEAYSTDNVAVRVQQIRFGASAHGESKPEVKFRMCVVTPNPPSALARNKINKLELGMTTFKEVEQPKSEQLVL